MRSGWAALFMALTVASACTGEPGNLPFAIAHDALAVDDAGPPPDADDTDGPCCLDVCRTDSSGDAGCGNPGCNGADLAANCILGEETGEDGGVMYSEAPAEIPLVEANETIIDSPDGIYPDPETRVGELISLGRHLIGGVNLPILPEPQELQCDGTKKKIATNFISNSRKHHTHQECIDTGEPPFGFTEGNVYGCVPNPAGACVINGVRQSHGPCWDKCGYSSHGSEHHSVGVNAWCALDKSTGSDQCVVKVEELTPTEHIQHGSGEHKHRCAWWSTCAFVFKDGDEREAVTGCVLDGATKQDWQKIQGTILPSGEATAYFIGAGGGYAALHKDGGGQVTAGIGLTLGPAGVFAMSMAGSSQGAWKKGKAVEWQATCNQETGKLSFWQVASSKEDGE